MSLTFRIFGFLLLAVLLQCVVVQSHSSHHLKVKSQHEPASVFLQHNSKLAKHHTAIKTADASDEELDDSDAAALLDAIFDGETEDEQVAQFIFFLLAAAENDEGPEGEAFIEAVFDSLDEDDQEALILAILAAVEEEQQEDVMDGLKGYVDRETLSAVAEATPSLIQRRSKLAKRRTAVKTAKHSTADASEEELDDSDIAELLDAIFDGETEDDQVAQFILFLLAAAENDEGPEGEAFIEAVFDSLDEDDQEALILAILAAVEEEQQEDVMDGLKGYVDHDTLSSVAEATPAFVQRKSKVTKRKSKLAKRRTAAVTSA